MKTCIYRIIKATKICQVKKIAPDKQTFGDQCLEGPWSHTNGKTAFINKINWWKRWPFVSFLTNNKIILLVDKI